MDTVDRDITNHASKELVIRHYGLLEPTNWGSDCEAEMRRIDDLWNNLVEIHDKYTEFYIKQLNADRAFEFAKTQFDAVDDHPSEIEIARTLKKKLAIAQKDATKSFASELRELEISRRNEVKIARQNSGLWWGNYNATVRAFERARSAVVRGGGTMRRRSEGMDARITNTLQGGADVASLFDGSLSQLSIHPVSERAWSAESRGERRRLQRTTLTATVFVNAGERRTVTWPMIMHRMIPDDCRVKEVIITRRRAANKWKWAVSLTCQRSIMPKTDASDPSNVVAVDIGWRRVSTGIRVATVVSKRNDPQFIILPNDLLQSFEFMDELRGRIADCAARGRLLLNEFDEMLVESPYRNLLLSARDSSKRTSSSLMSFCNSQFFARENNGVRNIDIDNWRSEFIRLTTWRSNHRRKIISRRLHLYHNFSSDIIKDTDCLVISDIKFGEIARRRGRTESQSFFPNRAKYYRIVAAPSELMRCIVLQAKKHQVALGHQTISSPIPCPNCGSPVRTSRADMLMQTCANCGTQYDVDVAACKALLSSHPSGG